MNLQRNLCLKAWGQPKQPKENGPTADNAAVERLLKMEPKVECTGDSMKLQVQDAASTPGSLFFVDRGEFSVCCGVNNNS